MPLYGYRCTACGKEEEYIQKFSDPPMTECEHCGGRLEKQMGAPAFHLKGGGWYKDGYASQKPGGEASTKKAADSTSKSTDSKSAGSKGSDAKSKSKSSGSSDAA